MRISDWSSDVCSSDLFDILARPPDDAALRAALARAVDAGPHKVNYAMQSRAVATVGAGAWSVTIEEFRATSRKLLQEIALAAGPQRAALLRDLASMTGAVDRKSTRLNSSH